MNKMTMYAEFKLYRNTPEGKTELYTEDQLDWMGRVFQ